LNPSGYYRKEVSFSILEAVSPPYLSLQLADGEEGIGDLVALLHLDRIVLRERRGASRHLERSELAFNIEGDNPGPTSEADIICNRWGWGILLRKDVERRGSTTRELMRGGEERG
jgi:hypothetical protein